MSGFNHRWRKVIDAPAPRRETYNGHGYWLDHCSWPKCQGQQIVAQVSYDYVTGRAGRISDARKFVCDGHLERWLKTNPKAVEVPAVAHRDANGSTLIRALRQPEC